MREARGVVGLGLERPVSLCPGEAVEYLGPSGGWDGGASVPKSKSRQVRLTHRKQEDGPRGVGQGHRRVLGRWKRQTDRAASARSF